MIARRFAWCLAVVALLQGCAGQPTVFGRSEQASLQQLRLFDANARPRFDFHLTCHSPDVSCINVENAFSKWAAARHVRLVILDDDDRFDNVGSGLGSRATTPYRLTVKFLPLIVPSYDESGGTSGNMRAGYEPPKVGYGATLQVFDRATGKRVLTMRVHDQRVAKYKADAGDYLRAEVAEFLAGLEVRPGRS